MNWEVEGAVRSTQLWPDGGTCYYIRAEIYLSGRRYIKKRLTARDDCSLTSLRISTRSYDLICLGILQI